MPIDELAEFRDLIGELPSTMTESTASPKNVLPLNTDDGDVDTLAVQALDGINIFGETEITALLVELVRRRLEDVLQCRLQRS
jgi:hypothetical protein